MKSTINLILLSSFFLLTNGALQAQSSKVTQDTLYVDGICGMCQKRIEEAAYGKGVKYASWDKHTKLLTLAYRNDKTSGEEISSRIVGAGHRVGEQEAKQEDYDNLPECCKYDHYDTH